MTVNRIDFKISPRSAVPRASDYRDSVTVGLLGGRQRRMMGQKLPERGLDGGEAPSPVDPQWSPILLASGGRGFNQAGNEPM